MNRTVRLAFAVVPAGLAIALTGLVLAVSSPAHAGPYRMVSRDYSWSSDHLTLDVPANVHFHPGPSWHLSIRAPEHALDQLVVKDGVIRARQHGCFSLIPFCIGFGTHFEQTMDVELTGPALRSVKVEGTGTVDLEGLRQDRLGLTIEGSATVRGSGSVNSAAVQIDGAGNIHLAQLTEARARVLIRGSGTVDIAPTDSVSVRIEGSGTVRLHSNPAQVTSHIFGAGEVIKVPANPAAGNPAR